MGIMLTANDSSRLTFVQANVSRIVEREIPIGWVISNRKGELGDLNIQVFQNFRKPEALGVIKSSICAFVHII